MLKTNVTDKVVLPFGDDGHPGWENHSRYTTLDGKRLLVQKRDGMTRTVIL